MERFYNLGAMEHYVRRIDPQALRDPRDEPMYTEEMDINDVYYSYLASQKKKDVLAITDGKEKEPIVGEGLLSMYYSELGMRVD